MQTNPLNFPSKPYNPSSDERAALVTSLSLVNIEGETWAVVELPGELVALGDWSFYRTSRAIFGPDSRYECEKFIGERIGKRLKVGKHAPRKPKETADEGPTACEAAAGG